MGGSEPSQFKNFCTNSAISLRSQPALRMLGWEERIAKTYI